MISFENHIQIWLTKKNPSNIDGRPDPALQNKSDAIVEELKKIYSRKNGNALALKLIGFTLGRHQGLQGSNYKVAQKRLIPIENLTISVQRNTASGWWASRRAMYQVRRLAKKTCGQESEVCFSDGPDYFYLSV